MVHTVYKTINIVNHHYYVGVHKTNDPQDDYLGSGKILKRAVAKYGRESFVKQILVQCATAEEAFAIEQRVINNYWGDPMCYNLVKGGHGGFDYLNATGLNTKGSKKVMAALRARMQEDSDFANRVQAAALAGRARWNATEDGRAHYLRHPPPLFTGRVHTAEARQKQSIAGRKRTGSKNSQFGTCWITRDGVSRKIRRDEIDSFVSNGWAPGRVMSHGSVV